jgi:hypothetical protein
MCSSRRKFLRESLMFSAGFIVLCTMAVSSLGKGKPIAGPPGVKFSVKHASAAAITGRERVAIAKAYGKQPLYFIANRGQVNGKVAYYGRGAGHTTYFTRNEIVLGMSKTEGKTDSTKHGIGKLKALSGKPQIRKIPDIRTSYLRIGMAGMNRDVQVVPQDLQPWKVNYFIGNDPRKWHTNIPTYKAVLYQNAYPGIDIRFYSINSQLEYDIIVKAGADPSRVKFHYAGARDMRLTKAGDLAIRLDTGELIQKKPQIYQEINGKKVLCAGSFTLREARRSTWNSKDLAHLGHVAGNVRQFMCSFDVGNYRKDLPLIIDPTLVYSTFLGGSGNWGILAGDTAVGISIDAHGDAYVTGLAYSSDFPVTSGAFQTSPKSSYYSNAFVTKIAPGGASLVYSTYLGGSGTSQVGGEEGVGIAIDAKGDAYVTGVTGSSDFPVTSGAFQITNKALPQSGHNAFVTEISPGGSTLVYSTYLGGSGALPGDGEWAHGIAIDSKGDAYVTGETFSPDFPVTSGAFQITNKAFRNFSGNAFVTEIAPGGASLVYSTYLGGSGTPYGDVEFANHIAVGAKDDTYLTGRTYSHHLPVTSGAFQASLNSSMRNAFVTGIAPVGSTLIKPAYWGGDGSDRLGDAAEGIAVDAKGDAYVTGHTTSCDFPVTSGAFQASLNSVMGNAFVTEISPDGSTLVYSTYLGGSGGFGGGEFANGIAVDASGNTYVTGLTYSYDFPVTYGAFQTTNKAFFIFGCNAFITEIAPGGGGLVYSTYLGGGEKPQAGQANGIAVDASGNAYVTGETASPDFPVTSGAFQTSSQSFSTGFVTELSTQFVNGVCGSSSGASFTSTPTSNLCSAGTPTSVTGAGPWNWICQGANGGTNQSCSANVPEGSGVCGSANGENFLKAPKTNLCSSGNASKVTGKGPWSWTCSGSTGSTMSCSANLIVNGTCGPSNGKAYSSAPTSNLCKSGAASSISGTGPWSWACEGANSGTNATCSAKLKVNGTCGSANKGNFFTQPEADLLCSSGNASSVAGKGPWKWTCAGSNGGKNTRCSANLRVNGSCGTSNGESFTKVPTKNLCSAGKASKITGTGPWNWTCAGSNDGTTASCSANIQ